MDGCLQVLGLPADSMRLVLERFHNDLRLLTNPSKTLKAEGFFKSNKVRRPLGETGLNVQVLHS